MPGGGVRGHLEQTGLLVLLSTERGRDGGRLQAFRPCLCYAVPGFLTACCLCGNSSPYSSSLPGFQHCHAFCRHCVPLPFSHLRRALPSKLSSPSLGYCACAPLRAAAYRSPFAALCLAKSRYPSFYAIHTGTAFPHVPLPLLHVRAAPCILWHAATRTCVLDGLFGHQDGTVGGHAILSSGVVYGRVGRSYFCVTLLSARRLGTSSFPSTAGFVSCAKRLLKPLRSSLSHTAVCFIALRRNAAGIYL